MKIETGTGLQKIAVGLLLLTAPLLMLPCRGAVAETNADLRLQIRAQLLLAHEASAVGQADSALVYLAKVLALDAANPDALFLVGQSKLALADTAGAEGALRAGAELAPLSSRIKLLLARLAVGGDRLAEADTLVAEVLAIKPHEAEALYVKGLIALARGDSTSALDALELSLRAELAGGHR